jgi:hypothetical protein
MLLAKQAAKPDIPRYAESHTALYMHPTALFSLGCTGACVETPVCRRMGQKQMVFFSCIAVCNFWSRYTRGSCFVIKKKNTCIAETRAAVYMLVKCHNTSVTVTQ